MYHLAKKIHQHIVQTDNFLLVPHQNPDGDALGSVSALAGYLLKMNKNVKIFCSTSVPEHFNYMAHAHLISPDKKMFLNPQINTVIILDSGDLAYAGIDQYLADHHKNIINIDHHQTNTEYGQFNLVNKYASATAEVIYGYFLANQILVDHEMATAMLTGIITDTGNFTNSATSVASINIAGQLLSRGANLNLINKRTLRNNTMDILKLWGIVFDRLEYNKEKDIAYTYLTLADFDRFRANDQEAEGISNFMNTISGVKVGLFLKETKEGKIKGSLRTTQDNVDVSLIAQKMGGGGHRKAAGFTADGTIQGTLDIILSLSF